MKKYSIFKYLTSYKTNSIIFRNFIAILIVILPILGIFAVLYINLARNANDDLASVYKQQLTKTVASFDNIYSEMKLFTYSISLNPAVTDFMNEPTPIENIEKFDYSKIMGTTYFAYKYVDSVYLYSEINRYVLSGTHNDIIDDFEDKSWLSNYSNLQNNELAITPRRTDDESAGYLSFILIVSNDIGERIGAVIVNLNIKSLLSTVVGDTTPEHELYVLNNYRKLVLSTNIDHMFDKLNQYTYVYNRMSSPDIDFVNTIKSDSSGLEYISISTKPKNGFPVTSILIVLCAVLLTIVAAFCISIYLTIRTFKPIHCIMEAIGKDFTAEKELGINDEISFIIENINSTIQDKRLVEIELEDRIALLNNAYTVALQAQINPHFLYNTLETINFLAYRHFKSSNDISTITVALSNMLRIGLDSESKVVPLSKELEHLQYYITIMELRYHGKCEFEFNIPHDLMNVMVVKLMFQPLVENAFLHGILPSGHKGIIRVTAFEEDKQLIIKIYDNGIGMDKETLRSTQTTLSSDIYISSKHIGINNINRRIKLLFGTDYGLSIESVYGRGTTFTIKLPIKTS